MKKIAKKAKMRVPRGKRSKADPMPDLMSEAEAAAYLGLCRLTVFRLRERGELGHYRIGSRIIYSRERHLIPFLESREVGPAAKARAASAS